MWSSSRVFLFNFSLRIFTTTLWPRTLFVLWVREIFFSIFRLFIYLSILVAFHPLTLVFLFFLVLYRQLSMYLVEGKFGPFTQHDGQKHVRNIATTTHVKHFWFVLRRRRWWWRQWRCLRQNENSFDFSRWLSFCFIGFGASVCIFAVRGYRRVMPSHRKVSQ